MSEKTVSSKSNESNDFVTWGHYNELYETTLIYLDEIENFITSALEGDVGSHEGEGVVFFEVDQKKFFALQKKMTTFRDITDQLKRLAHGLIIPKEPAEYLVQKKTLSGYGPKTASMLGGPHLIVFWKKSKGPISILFGLQQRFLITDRRQKSELKE